MIDSTPRPRPTSLRSGWRATPPLVLACAVMAAFAACREPDPSPDEPPSRSEPAPTSPAAEADRVWERRFVFLPAESDSGPVVPWFFLARTTAEGVTRRSRGWLFRSGTWEAFLEDSWSALPTRSPWLPLPRRPLRLVVGPTGAPTALLYEESGRSLEVGIGDLLVEWSDRSDETWTVHEGHLLLAGRSLRGWVVDLRRVRAADTHPSADWSFLVSGDSIALVLREENPEPNRGGERDSAPLFRGWVLRADSTRALEPVEMEWTEVRAYEPARRDIPVRWRLGPPTAGPPDLPAAPAEGSGVLSGELELTGAELSAEEGDEAQPPVEALLAVRGSLTIEGRTYAVHGLMRHLQR